MTSEAPERIWLQWVEPYCDDNTFCVDQINENDPKYVRADLHQQAIEAARAEGVIQGMKIATSVPIEKVPEAIRALSPTPPDQLAEAAIPHTPTTTQLQSVCYSMRHDYGLMTRAEQETLEFHAAEAWKAVASALAQKEADT